MKFMLKKLPPYIFVLTKMLYKLIKDNANFVLQKSLSILIFFFNISVWYYFQFGVSQ